MLTKNNNCLFLLIFFERHDECVEKMAPNYQHSAQYWALLFFGKLVYSEIQSH